MQSIILEIRSAAGGEEARIWAVDLLRMYTRFAASQGWSVTPLDKNIIKIKGDFVWEKLKNEAGVHRVQRVPETERYGRIHTSTATIAVLPEISANQIQIKPEEIEMQTFRASGHGGQNVNRRATAVRLTHRPTGLVVECQTQRDQHQNRQLAMQMLAAKLYQKQQVQQQAQISGQRAEQVGRGMRAEKVRTYNFPQNRVNDHRLKKKFRLEDIINGRLEKLTKLLSQSSNSS